MTSLQAKLDTIKEVRRKSAERDRLLQVLEFYAWLEVHGTSWDKIKGLRPLDNTPRHRNEFKRSCRVHGNEHIWEQYNYADMVEVQVSGLRWTWVKYDPEVHDEHKVVRRPYAYRGKFLDILLKDGRQLILPWPPFPEDVVYNRQRN